MPSPITSSQGTSRRKFVKAVVAAGAVVAVAATAGYYLWPKEEEIPTVTPTVTAPELPKRGGTLTLAYAFDAVTLDAHGKAMAPGIAAMQNIYSYLFRYDKDMKFVPDIALSFDVSPEADKYTFHLRDGVKFTDGSDVDADAVRYSFMRVMDPAESGGPGGNTGEMRGEISTIDVIDRLTVRFNLKATSVVFLYRALRLAGVGIVPTDTMKKYGPMPKFGRQPIGSGPFKFVEWKEGESITLERNPDYYKAKEGLPYLDKLIIKIIPDDSARVFALRTAEVDMLQEFPPSLVPDVEKDPDIALLTRPSLEYTFLMINSDRFGKKERQAINLAIDRKAIVDTAYLGRFAVPANCLIPVGLPQYHRTDTLWTYEHAPEKAKQLLAEAGKQNLTFSVLVASGVRVYADVATLLQTQWAEAGITAKIEVLESGTQSSRTWAEKPDYDMTFKRWTGAMPDPDMYVGNLMSTAAQKPVGTSFDYKTTDKLQQEGRQETDLEKRKGIYSSLEDVLADECVWTSLNYLMLVEATRKNVKGYYLLVTTYGLLEKVWKAT